MHLFREHPGGGQTRQQLFSEIQRHVLRVSCQRCERTVEIQSVDAVRLYGGNTILASQSEASRAKGEALIQQADRLLCESWNERMWSWADDKERHTCECGPRRRQVCPTFNTP